MTTAHRLASAGPGDEIGARAVVTERTVSRARRLLPAVLALVVLAATAVVWLGRPPGQMQGAQTQSVVVTGFAGPLLPGVTVSQPLLATEDDLSGVEAVFGTYGGVTRCALDVTVTDDTGTAVHEGVVPCGDLIDTGASSSIADFDPIEDSAGRTYVVDITAAAGSGPDAVVVWSGEPQGAAQPALVDGAPVETATSMIAEYEAPPVWEQAALALDRIGLGAPWWSQPTAMVVWALVLVGGVIGALATAGSSLRAATALLVVVALARGLLWASAMPPLEGMDEGAHVAYAQFLAEEDRIPVRGEASDGLANAYSEQLLVLDEHQRRGAQTPGDRAERTPEALVQLELDLLAASPAANGNSPAAGYPPVYYAPAALAYELASDTLHAKVYAMRLISVALGAMAAAATMVVARRLLPGTPVAAVLLALAVTLQPMIAHQFAIVNNDALVIVGGVAAFAGALRLATGRFTARHVVATGLAVGLALLAKPFGVGVLPVVGVGWLVGVVRARLGLPAVLRSAGVAVASLAATYGLWVAVQAVAGYPSTAPPVDPAGEPDRSPSHYVALQFADDMQAVRDKWEHLWGQFAWLDVLLPVRSYEVLWTLLWVLVPLLGVWLAVTLLRGLVGLSPAARRRRRGRVPGTSSGAAGARGAAGGAERRRGVDAGVPPAGSTSVAAHGSTALGPGSPPALGSTTRTALSMVYLFGLLATLYAAGYLYFRSSGQDALLQGRYALMALPALLALPALVLQDLTSRARGAWARALPAVVLGVAAVGVWVLHVQGLASILDRFYL